MKYRFEREVIFQGVRWYMEGCFSQGAESVSTIYRLFLRNQGDRFTLDGLENTNVGIDYSVMDGCRATNVPESLISYTPEAIAKINANKTKEAMGV